MRLGTETGSLANWIMSGQKAIVPELETPATILSWTDRHPATVTRVWKQGKFHYLEVTMDEWERVDKNGFSEVQEYVYTRNPNGPKYYYRITDDGYKSVRQNANGRWVLSSGGLVVGFREAYRDPSF